MAVQPAMNRQTRTETILAPGRHAAHRAAEQAVAGGDAGHVRAVRAGDDADVDDFVLAIGLDDKRHALGDGVAGLSVPK